MSSYVNFLGGRCPHMPFFIGGHMSGGKCPTLLSEDPDEISQNATSHQVDGQPCDFCDYFVLVFGQH